MKELGLSILAHGPDTIRTLRPWLDQFEAEHRVRIEVELYEWEAAWPEILKTALYKHGPDISEMGSTWVSSLIAMDALRPFSANELEMCGGASAFLPSVWHPGLEARSGEVWALPWLPYARLIYYRRDVLDQAGIDEHSAFQTPEHLAQTLERLAESGVAMPWCVPTQHSRDTIHNIASWVWSAGGEFASADGKRVLFNKPKALAGMRAYFDLHRYLAPLARGRDETDSLFKRGQAAIVMSGPWLWPLDTNQPDVIPQVASNIGVAVPFGTAFIGFSYLVRWKHSMNKALAMKLIHKLLSPDILPVYSQRMGGPLSVRLDALENSSLASEPNYQVMVQGLKTGRTFPQISLWALIEEKLDAALEKIWDEVLGESRPDIDTILKKHLDPLARRLEITLSQ